MYSRVICLHRDQIMGRYYCGEKCLEKKIWLKILITQRGTHDKCTRLKIGRSQINEEKNRSHFHIARRTEKGFLIAKWELSNENGILMGRRDYRHFNWFEFDDVSSCPHSKYRNSHGQPHGKKSIKNQLNRIWNDAPAPKIKGVTVLHELQQVQCAVRRLRCPNVPFIGPTP